MRLHELEGRDSPSVLSGFPGPISSSSNGSETAFAAGSGGGPVVEVYDSAGSLTSSFFAFDQSFRGGIAVVLDGPLVRVAPAVGSGGGPVLYTFDLHGALLDSRFVGDPASRNGVDLSAVQFPQLGPPPPTTEERLAARGIVSRGTSQLTEALDAAEMLTTDFYDRLRAEGGGLVLTVGRLTAEPELAFLAGTTNTSLGEPYDDALGLNKDGLAFARVDVSGITRRVLHELGHSIDFLAGYPSLSDEFAAICERNPASGRNANPIERFAESVTDFVLGVPQPAEVAAFASRHTLRYLS